MKAINLRENHKHCVNRRLLLTRTLIAVFVACTQLLIVARGQGSPEVTPTPAHKLTVNASHLVGSGFQLSVFVETGSTADVCIAAFNTSNRPEDLAPILCSPIEYRGKRGVRLLSYLPAHPPDDFVAALTVYQQGAQYYGPPIRCDIR